MQLYSRKESIERMNDLAGKGRPFLFVTDYRQEHSYVEEISEVDSDFCRYSFNGVTNVEKECEEYDGTLIWEVAPPALEEYRIAFDVVKDNIWAGNSYLTNLTCKVPVETNLTLEAIFRYSDARRLVMNDRKEAAEHATIVDLIRNDLSMVSEQVTVTRYRFCDCLETNKGPILQTSSEICGVLPEDYLSHIGDIVFRLLPAGSITGAPKPKTMEIIAEAENYERGFYTGVMGYFDGRNLDSAVMIRFIEQENGHLYFKAGGGITSKSALESEYNEVIQKIYVPIY